MLKYLDYISCASIISAEAISKSTQSRFLVVDIIEYADKIFGDAGIMQPGPEAMAANTISALLRIYKAVHAKGNDNGYQHPGVFCGETCQNICGMGSEQTVDQ